MSVFSQATKSTLAHKHLPLIQSAKIPLCADFCYCPVLPTAIAFNYDDFKTGVSFMTFSETGGCACEV
ncbi:MAG: hypothetical protein KME21_02710 [Desmonostoc vinosum HA7617-LM4]|nr:hypothetical protein [Desmonostoc vinosum HA7617-LM4]